MMALPVWKLSVDSQQPKLAPCTRSQSARNLSSLVAAAEGCVLGLPAAHARRKTKVLRLHGGYRPASTSLHGGPAGVEALG